ncbi:MAG: hypothetical protein SVU88_02135 [Candidatus Nanohaloarchaea archaeon]|nr:hypothetical protein [Candidatus Nanohaloarchaea archaeon]
MEALRSEVERNLELAGAAKRLVDRERDMLQAEPQDRAVFHRFHTAAWDSVVNRGGVAELGEAGKPVADCYMQLEEVNQLLDWFDRRGNRVAYIPLVSGSLDGYGRKEVIEVLREKFDEAEVVLRDARRALDESPDL